MLAGLGIGGIALALAAQKTLEDLFGGISIIMRDAIRVGDYCRLADESGTIEDIGLSATRLRTLDRTVVSIPNSKIAQMSSENIALRDKFWFHHILSLRYDTSKAQIEQILANVSTTLQQRPQIESGTNRINFIGLQEASFQIEIFAYVVVASYPDFLVRQQELLLQILTIVADSGAHLMVPLQGPYGKDIMKVT
jgi:MscS family membrane protein